MKQLARLGLTALAVLALAAAAAAGPLDPVVAALDKAKAEKATPVVVFDLDGTLFSTDARHAKILKEWAAEHAADQPAAAARLAGVTDADGADYSVEGNLAKLGLTDEVVVNSVKESWWKKFFTNDYVLVDPPIAGAVAFVKRCHDAGAVIVYLTGRDIPNMGKGTQRALEQAGFPIGDERSFLMLKPDQKTKDKTFKSDACANVAKLGRVVAMFENQPRNLVAQAKAFPDALPVFVETNFDAKDEEPVPAKAIRIKSYDGK